MGNPLIPVPQQDDGQRWREGRRYRTISNDIERYRIWIIWIIWIQEDEVRSKLISSKFLSILVIMFHHVYLLSILVMFINLSLSAKLG